tara:strand:+ start:622 stop:3435 length:2814 start_codon:yes stop_codon:yes gene_type:complete
LVNSNWTFTVTHYDKSNSWTSTDISADAFPRYFTDTGGDKVNAAKVRIIAVDGQYIQSGVNSKPHIQHNDRVRIAATDGNSGTYNKVFDVIKIIPIKSKTEGVMVELELLGIERWLQKCNYSARVFAQTPRDIFSDLVEVYHDNRATNTPSINLSSASDPSTITVNELPTAIKLHLDWGNNEDTIFNRMQEVVEKMSSSQSTGGILDFFDIRFTCHPTLVTEFNIEVFSSGDKNRITSPVVLNSTDINTEDTSGGFEEPQGLLLNSWGASGNGSLPTNWSKFNSRILIAPEDLGSKTLLPEWDNTFTYTTGAVVKYTAGTVDKIYKALRETINDTPNSSTSDWDEITHDEYIDGITYSPWTRSSVATDAEEWWDASMANPSGGSGSPFGSKCCAWDANIIVLDDSSFRTWADIISYNSSITVSHPEWLYDGTTPYDGLRIFVKGAGNGDFANFSNCIMEYDNGVWIRKYELVTDYMVAVMENAKVWRYDGSNSYTDFTTYDNGVDCFHPSDNVGGRHANAASSIRNTQSGTAVDYTNNSDSTITQSYRWTPIEAHFIEWGQDILAAATGPVGQAVKWIFPLNDAGTAIQTPRTNSTDWYQAGAWLCLRFPFPKNTFGSGLSSSELGINYGGSTSENKVPFLDFQNMTYSHDGKRGFNQGVSSEDLGPVDSIDFNMKIKYEANILATSALQKLAKEQFPMKCVLIDRNDNVVTQDFTVLFNDNWEAISLPLNGFSIYRGRKPMTKAGFYIDYIVPPKEKPLFTQFEWRHVAMMCIQSTDSYDDNGRYRGASDNDWGTGSWLYNSQTMTFLQTTISLDGLRFSKPLLANSGEVTDLTNETDFLQNPDIEIYDSLKQNLDSELQKHKFKNKRYDISTEGEFDVQFGDFFVLKDAEIVDETYNGNPNQIKLVAKHIEYEFSKPNESSGGFERRILGAKRFE